jgi:SET domain-containing protein
VNTKESQFCTDKNCPYAGSCGNALLEHPPLIIAHSSLTGMQGLVAKDPIRAGVVLSKYLGHLDLFGPECRNGPVNDGYRMYPKTRSTGGKYLGIDGKDMGGKLRMMNHACNPPSRFHEVQTGTRLTVVAVTIRDVVTGEQGTVSYGDCLWFTCRCGWFGCQHRNLQHLLDIDEKAA